MLCQFSLDVITTNYPAWAKINFILENLNASPAEFVYGKNLRLPFHFFEIAKPRIDSDPHTFVERLKSMMDRLKPI